MFEQLLERRAEEALSDAPVAKRKRQPSQVIKTGSISQSA